MDYKLLSPKEKRYIYLIYGLLLLIGLILVSLFTYIIINRNEVLSYPLIYSAKFLNAESCECSYFQEGKLTKIYFNTTTIETQKQRDAELSKTFYNTNDFNI